MGSHKTRLLALVGGMVAGLLIGISAPVEAQVLSKLTDTDPYRILGRSLNDDGTVAVAVWRGDPLGSNPGHEFQIFKWVLPDGNVTQLTSFPGGVHKSVSITDDGEWLVFDSTADPLEQNGDGSNELFLIRLNGSDLVQLTNDKVIGDGHPRCPMVAGSGNRVVFWGTYDPIGTNPDRREQLFVIDPATSQLTQITHGDSGLHTQTCPDLQCSPTISDDGERIVFSSSADLTGGNPDGSFEVFRVDADGQNLVQLTTTTLDSVARAISGDGQVIVLEREDHVIAINWNGTGLTTLDEGQDPSIIDNGARVYYRTNYEIYWIPRTGGTGSPVTSPSDGIDNKKPIVSGSGARVIFLGSGGEYPGGDNQDGGRELIAADGSGANPRQLTTSGLYEVRWEPTISSDGSRIVYTGSGWEPFLSGGIFRMDVDDPEPVQVIADSDFPTNPAVTADGETIVFLSRSDLAGEGACSDRDVFQVQADGTGVQQLTFPDDCQYSVYPALATHGGMVVFQSYGSFGGLNGNLFSVPLGGGAATPIANDGSGWIKYPAASADGIWAAWQSQAPDGSIQVFRGRTDGTFVEMLTADPDYRAGSPDISRDGQLVVYVSIADALGTNPDHNQELFLYDAGSGTTLQLTTTTEGSSSIPRITEDGAMVYFYSSSPLLGPGPGNPGLFRILLGTGTIERAGGTNTVTLPGGWSNLNLAVDADGGRAVFMSASGMRADGFHCRGEIWLSDFETPATIRPSAEAPTVVEWDPDPRALRYDVIRGDVASLGSGPGGTVDLGPVVCLENDSLNTSTAGAEADPGQPASGQAFFYLYRFSSGSETGPGSYRQGATGDDRFPAEGDCPQ